MCRFSRTRLYRHFEFLGPAYGLEVFDDPLPGTNGRGVAVVETKWAIQVWFDGPVKTLELTNDAPEGTETKREQRSLAAEFRKTEGQ